MYDNDYWDDDYYLNHRNEKYNNYSPGKGIKGLFSLTLLIIGIMIAVLCAPVGAFIMLMAIKLGE